MRDSVCQTCDIIRGLLMAQGVPAPVADVATLPVARAEEVVEKKVKRKVSKYQREFGRHLKILKVKHPRTKVQTLMKRAHKMTKKMLK